MITMTTHDDQALGRARMAGHACASVRIIDLNTWRNPANPLPFVSCGNASVLVPNADLDRNAHLDSATTTPAGSMGYMSVKPPARHLRPRIT